MTHAATLRLALLCLAAILSTPAARAESRALVGEAVRDYAQAVADGGDSLVRLRGWPEQGFPGVRLSTEVREPKGNRLPYDIVATVEDPEGCEAAIKGAAEGSREIVVGSLLLMPSDVRERPRPNGKSMLRPAEGFCKDQFYPSRIRFVRDALIRVPEAR